MDFYTWLSLLGVTLIITRSSIVEAVKDRLPAKWVKLLDCPMCSGFWVGIVYGFGSVDIGNYSQLSHAIGFGFIISLSSYCVILITDSLSKYLEN